MSNVMEGWKDPPFFDYLSKLDKDQYKKLYSELGIYQCKKFQRIEQFQSMLSKIKEFCIKNDKDDWKRCLVSGICWFKQSIYTNTFQLKILLQKSKSAINGALQLCGYKTVDLKEQDFTPLFKLIPILNQLPNERRRWSIRTSVISKQKVNSILMNSVLSAIDESKKLDPKFLPSLVCNSNLNKNIDSTQNDEFTFDEPIHPISNETKKQCAFGCTCGCDCQLDGSYTKLCTCSYPDDPADIERNACPCIKIDNDFHSNYD